MRVTSSAISLTVPDAAASAAFWRDRLGFRVETEGDGFVSLTRDDTGMAVVFLDQGRPTVPAERSAGVVVTYAVDDLEGEMTWLEAEGVEITMPLTVERWGERAFQVSDPNGVVVQLVDRNGPTA